MHKALFLALLGGLLGQAAATTYPYSLTDDLGRKVTIKAEPKRIVSMLPSSTETICALGACDRLVGVDTFSDFPAQVGKLPKMGGLYDPNIEAIVAQKPDLVVVSKYGKLAEPLSAAGLNVVAVNPETYDDVFNKTFLLGKILNREAQALALVTSLKRDIAKIEILSKNAVKKPTVYFEVDPAPYSVGPKSFMGVMIEKAGGRNIIPASLGDFPKIDPELVVKANPQLMLGLSREEAARRAGWGGLQAIKTGKVFKLSTELNTMLGRPGPRLALALRGLAQIIHPELFKPEPRKE